MKEDHMSAHIPIACVPSAMTVEQREKYEQLIEEMSKCRLETYELPNGYAVCYPAESSMIIKLAEFISLERLCCPFLNFELRVEANRPVWLHLTGGEGVKGFLKETFTWISSD
ncbi:hypothetical protein [Thermoflavimicrobium dichotomicum]|uniref:Uncharacterized protein n=1 Tax=Thermoflavimicrobium dichotomicum TaxID=46223 RepID=A0A1I3LAB3_9BACL|nr:hypothetical protein [Thermoflavimicrobium dichotomicum]SFI81694.1 hypothetical protein SAMN05421852_102108 [Thermoflavimicrobium dichotomicum]